LPIDKVNKLLLLLKNKAMGDICLHACERNPEAKKA
jgi:hypothetical protein